MAKPNNNINDLVPELRVLAVEFMKIAEAQGLKVMIYETYRSLSAQMDAFKKGTSKAKPGMSMHQYGYAFDVVFQGSEPWGEHHPWNKLGQISRDCGLYWGGDWGPAPGKGWDRPHHQLVPATDKHQDAVRAGVFTPMMPLKTVKQGDKKCLEILMLQKFLGLEADGVFGPKTEAAVKDVQSKAQLLTVNGICGWGTWKRVIGIVA